MIDTYVAWKTAKGLALRIPVVRERLGASYPFLHTPGQLIYLCSCLEATRDVPGSVVEAGCVQDHTTLFLNRYMSREGIEKPYWAIDTFSGLRDDDLHVDVERGQQRDHHHGRLTLNDRRWFDHSMRRGGVTRVRSVAADVGAFGFGQAGPIAFCLINVVNYRPVKLALPRIWDALAPGGVVVVDNESSAFGGAGHAYREFAAARGVAPRRVQKDYGVLFKGPAKLEEVAQLRDIA